MTSPAADALTAATAHAQEGDTIFRILFAFFLIVALVKLRNWLEHRKKPPA